jgi:hypothetical protein
VRLLSMRWSLLVVAAFAAGASFAACSSSNKGASHVDAGEHDASLDGDEDVSEDVAPAPDDVAVYPEAPSLLSPDGCYRQSAACMDDTTCCSGYCVDGGCEIPTKQQ